MNHLAHALLADAGGVEFAMGSAMGDFVRGRPDPTWPSARQAGLRFHRAVDRFTDSHPEIVAARARFGPPLRRYAGIFLDVWFDHLLVHAWDAYCTEPLPAFSRRWLSLLDRRAAKLPPSLQSFLGWMHAHDLPIAYGDDAILDEVFHALAGRLSRPSPIADVLPELLAQDTPLQRHFDAFFPHLTAFAIEQRGELLNGVHSGDNGFSPLR